MTTIIDWSEWDNARHPGLDVRGFFAGYDGVLVRVANENGGQDIHATENVASAKACGKPWGLYAWPLIGHGYDANRNYARGLVQRWGVGPLGMAADAERIAGSIATVPDIEGFCAGVTDAGAVPLYYCAILELQRGVALDQIQWWVADYSQNDGQYHDPNELPPRPPTDRPWILHQYTSLGWPGGGPLDVSYAPSVFPPVPPVHEEDTDMPWIAVGDALAGRLAAVIDGGYKVGDLFTGPVGAYNIPQSALDWNAHDGRGLKFVDLDPDRFAAVIHDHPTGVTPGAPCKFPDSLKVKLEGTAQP